MNNIARRLGIDRKELDKLFLLILHSFFSAIFVSIFFSVANAEFVNNFGSDFLPVGYLLSGAVGYLTVQGYSRLLKKSGYSAFVGGLVFLLVCTLLFRSALFVTGPAGTKWLSFVIFLFAMPFLAISGLEQAGLLLKIYDIREGKKYAGIVNSGGTAASIVGYLSIPVLIPFLRSRYDLFFIALFGISIALYFLFRINRSVNLKEQKPSGGPAPVKADTSLPALLKQKYILYIAICGGISMMAFYFIDYSFLINAKAQARSPEQLSAIIGGFFAFIKTAELILSLLSGRIFRSFGLKTGIIVLPATCAFVTLCAIVSYHFSGGWAFLFFVFALKFFERCVSKAIEEPTYKNLYQLLNASDRLAIQAKIDGGTKQLFIILGSVILLLYGRFMPAEHLKIGLLYVSIPIFLFWLYSARQLVRSFKERLRDLLNPGNLKSEQSSAFDKLRTLFSESRKSTTSAHVVMDLLGHKLPLSPGKKEIPLTTEKVTAQELFVPHPFFNYLVPSQNGSRLELQLYQPLLVIPPTEAPVESSGPKSAEFLDEKEILQLALSAEEPNEATIAALGRKLDDLKNDHEKKLVLNILGRATHPLSTSILLQHLDYPDYYTRKQVFKTLETKNFKYNEQEEIFYRNALEAVLSDITYLVSAMSSIPNNAEFSDLLRALYEEESILKNRLLSILTWVYDKASISVIRENIFAGSADAKQANNILALELIDNLVESEIKPKVMPVFESGLYLRRLSALNKWYHFPQLSLKDTLINLLHYDYTKLGTWTKACVLKIMLKDKAKEYRQIISGFSYHPNALLRALAHEYSETLNGNTIYPLRPKEDSFSSGGKNKFSQLKGTETYECIKALKENTFFKKAAFSDLVRFSFSMEAKGYVEVRELAASSSSKNKPAFILGGNVILEFKKNFPAEVFYENCILPEQFNATRFSKLLVRSQTSLYDLSSVHLANLLLSSDSMLGDVMRYEAQHGL